MSEEIKTAIGIKNKIKCLFKGYVEKYVFPLFVNIIFISNYNKKLFPHKKIFSSIIANPVNPIFFATAKPNIVLNSLIYVGVINKNKNLKLILDALAILKKENIIFNLNVVGGYKEAYYENEILSIVNKHNLTEQVVFHGWQTQEQILELYEHCGILVLPSQQENMPVSIGEGMAQGKVVLASNVGAISEMITDNTSGFLFEKNNVEQLCALLRKLFNNKTLMESVSLQARKEANEKFHPDLIALKTWEFYNQVIKRSSPL
jgi:glycosyltransferase involved in cell wall biosynthesis